MLVSDMRPVERFELTIERFSQKALQINEINDGYDGLLIGSTHRFHQRRLARLEVSKHNSSKKSGSSSSSSGEKTSSGNYAVGPYGVVQQTNPDDPSTFIKDDRLKQSFYGMAYTPENSQLPNCGNSLGTRSPRGLAARRRPPRVCTG